MDLKEELLRWKEKTYSRVLKKFPERKADFQTPSEIPVLRCWRLKRMGLSTWKN